MQRIGSGLGLVGAYGINSDEELNASNEQEDGIDTISGSDDEGSHAKYDVTDVALSSLNALKRSPSSRADTESPLPKHEKKGAGGLVSYGGDEVESDDDKDNEPVDMDVVDSDSSEAEDEEALLSAAKESLLRNRDGKVKLPPEPPGRCSKQLQDKIDKLMKKSRVGYNLNQSIQNRKDFRNPGIYEKLIQFCKIDEKGTNYPPELFDPSIWGPESFYDELAKAQKVEMDKREKERKERTKIEFASGTKKDASSLEPKRKSKWDTQPTNMPAGHVAVPPPVTISTVASGTKATVIPAVGSLPKKK